jgi:hypothetical protein
MWTTFGSAERAAFLLHWLERDGVTEQMTALSLIREERLAGHIDGYPSTIAPEFAIAYDSIARPMRKAS